MTRLIGFLIPILLSFASLSMTVYAESERYVESENGVSQLESVESVNINTATVERLSNVLKGVGKKRAQAIIDYRETNGPFVDITQLLEIKGIGKATIEKNREKIRL